MPFISVRYLTFPTIEEVFPLPALLTTKQLSSSETLNVFVACLMDILDNGRKNLYECQAKCYNALIMLVLQVC